MNRSIAFAGLLTATLAVAGCADDPVQETRAAPAPSTSAAPVTSAAPTSGPPISVVASTNVYGDIASRIGGDRVQVISIIDDTSAGQDPHSFEVSPRNQLAISDADLVIENGGGYDEFMERLVAATGGDRRVITAVEVAEEGRSESTDTAVDESGTSTAPPTTAAPRETSSAASDVAEPEAESEAESEGENEHVWYDLDVMGTLADEIAEELAELEPSSRALFESNAAGFTTGIGDLKSRQAAIKAAHAGTSVAITEPLPAYLLEEAGLVDETPADFTEAIEEGTDASARTLAETLALFSTNAVEVLIYNDQTTGPQTEAMRAAAEKAGVPVVAMSETLPEGLDYLAWMGRNLDALRDALA